MQLTRFFKRTPDNQAKVLAGFSPVNIDQLQSALDNARMANLYLWNAIEDLEDLRGGVSADHPACPLIHVLTISVGRQWNRGTRLQVYLRKAHEVASRGSL